MAKEQIDSGHGNALRHPLQALRGELQNSVEKLKDSNRQLQMAIQDGDKDPELRTAIGENIVTIARQQARIAGLDKELSQGNMI